MGRFFRFQRNLKLLGGLGGFSSNALGTHMYNFEMLDFNREFFACLKTKMFLFVLQSREISNTVAFPEYGECWGFISLTLTHIFS